ncbi:MAG TPA: DnaB-like helicase C-terminal domain-containing protein, partial [Alphaproteobacteria bacterium]|nr:DnaB-like helicase C-terminal domain-containing protein [Alphaproteobacteria bacterium]
RVRSSLRPETDAGIRSRKRIFGPCRRIMRREPASCQRNLGQRDKPSRDDNRPQLEDLRDTASIERDADVVMFLHREQYYLERIEEPAPDTMLHDKWIRDLENAEGTAEIIVAKNRHGPIGQLLLAFDPISTAFGDLVV